MPLDGVRYEVLPFASAEPDARAVARPLTLTVTCSPKHGVDHALDAASRLRALGHTVVLHVAARMVRGEGHVDELLGRMAAEDIHDVFLIGGDAPAPLGPYASAGELLPLLRAHADAPRTIGVAAYPEGHPLIADDVLRDALRAKDDADYMTTQMCFDAGALLRWLEAAREAGVELPAYVGVPGVVDARRLLEVGARIGVGASLRYFRKQHGIGRLLRKPEAAAARLIDAVGPHVGGPLGVAGLHVFTFDRLAASAAFIHKEPSLT